MWAVAIVSNRNINSLAVVALGQILVLYHQMLGAISKCLNGLQNVAKIGKNFVSYNQRTTLWASNTRTVKSSNITIICISTKEKPKKSYFCVWPSSSHLLRQREWKMCPQIKAHKLPSVKGLRQMLHGIVNGWQRTEANALHAHNIYSKSIPSVTNGDSSQTIWFEKDALCDRECACCYSSLQMKCKILHFYCMTNYCILCALQYEFSLRLAKTLNV